MYKLVVGGDFGTKKESGIARKIAENLSSDLSNGGTIEDLENVLDVVENYDLVIWMPNIDNEIPKDYPTKKKGSILICSKVLRDDRTIGDAVSRIFKMNANAVIAIDTSYQFAQFELLDALGNSWVKTFNIDELVNGIERLVEWTKGSVRIGTTLSISTISYNRNVEIEQKFCDIVKTVSQKVENERGGRYFGNASTRCSFMFPSCREKDNVGILVSGRNMPKTHLSPDDFVFVYPDNEYLRYDGLKKPSVDTPVQFDLYEMYPNINFMIHGHAYIEGAPTTEHYFPCGDLREVNSIIDLLPSELSNLVAINLKNHGFLIMSSNLEELEEFVNNAKFNYRELGEKI